MKLTQAIVAKIMPEPGKFEGRFFDSELKGFGIRVWDPKNPKRVWIIQYRRRRDGKTTTYKLGRCERMSASVARDLAKQKLAQAELGIDPGQEQETARNHAAETFEVVAARFLKTKESLRSRSQIEGYLTKHWAPLNRQSIHAITRRDIASRLGEIAEQSGHYSANRARSALSTFFGWAMREGLLDGLDSNPVIATNRYSEEARDRVLSDRELVAIWKACKADDFGDVVRLLVLTGQRRDEVGGIKRGEIDLRARKWTIPAERTKNRRVHEVWLSDPALRILEQAMSREGQGDRAALFGAGANANGFRGYGAAKARLDKRLAQTMQEGWRLHDLRRSAASGMQRLGVRVEVIERILNHVSGSFRGIVGVYQRDPMSTDARQALDMWAEHVLAIVAGEPASNVRTLRRGA